MAQTLALLLLLLLLPSSLMVGCGEKGATVHSAALLIALTVAPTLLDAMVCTPLFTAATVLVTASTEAVTAETVPETIAEGTWTTA